MAPIAICRSPAAGPVAATSRHPRVRPFRLCGGRGKAEGGDPVSVTAAAAGVARTGTLMLTSAPERPTTLNFLPDTHIVLIPRSRIVGSYEDAWSALRDRLRQAGEALPRTVNFIT